VVKIFDAIGRWPVLCTGRTLYDSGFVGPDLGSAPVPRICTNRCSVSNQKGAPNSVASMVKIHPGAAQTRASVK
jgi:hypothetical protein